ncbi:carboxypeptidase regulatory-like domain-containing protein [Paraburkholderia sp. 2C]
MQLKTIQRSTVACAATLLLTLSGYAFAQSPDLPPVQTQGDISYVSGGIGHDEAEALHHDENQWPLALGFFGPTADYLADVHVRIADSKGTEVMHADSRGPYMLVKLPAGSYNVYARYKTEEKHQVVNVSGNGHQRVSFRFSIQ